MDKIFDKIKSFFKQNSEIVTPTAVLAIICIVVTLALSSSNLLTYKKIDALRKVSEGEAMKRVMKGTYTEVKETVDGDDITYNIVKKGTETIGYIFTTSSKGYGGSISVMTAVNVDGTVAAIEILDASNETPGLGQNITKPDWYTQFKTLKEKITVVKSNGALKENNEINAVTGATISSRGVTNAVNQALKYANEIIAKEDKS